MPDNLCLQAGIVQRLTLSKIYAPASELSGIASFVNVTSLIETARGAERVTGTSLEVILAVSDPVALYIVPDRVLSKMIALPLDGAFVEAVYVPTARKGVFADRRTLGLMIK
jgi:hypothetical protein